ncbi:MAG: protein O-mannosyl-transferase family [Thermoleophilia bacterium]
MLYTAALATRTPLISDTLYNWDSVNFALGLENFSVAEHQPHAPGYILYIALGRVLQALLGDPNNALVAISIFGSAAAVAVIYLVGNSIFNRTTGIVAAVLLMFSPLAWFYSEIALPYGFKMLLVMLATWLIYELIFHKRYPVVSAFALGVAAGFRQDVLIFLGPLWLYGTLRIDRRTMLLAWGALGVSVLAWLAPLVYMAGGISTYRQITNEQYTTGVRPSSVFALGMTAFITNVKRVIQAVFWMFGPACIGLLYPAGLFLHPKAPRDERLTVVFLLLLMVLPCVFFFFFLFDPLGYLLVYVTPLLLLVARGFALVTESISRKYARSRADSNFGWSYLVTALVIIAAMNSYLFINAANISWSLPTTDPLSAVFGTFSASGIRDADEEIDIAISAVSIHDPEITLVVTGVQPFSPYAADWRRLMFYLPEYRIVMIKTGIWKGYLEGEAHTFRESGTNLITVPEKYRQVLFVELDQPDGYPVQLSPVTYDGAALLQSGIIDFPPEGRLQVRQYTFSR